MHIHFFSAPPFFFTVFLSEHRVDIHPWSRPFTLFDPLGWPLFFRIRNHEFHVFEFSGYFLNRNVSLTEFNDMGKGD